MEPKARVVIDTNVLVSALLSPHSPPGHATGRVLDYAILLASEATLAEIEEVLTRPKLAKVLSGEDSARFLRDYRNGVHLVSIDNPIQACRDPHDDKFLEVAINGKADILVTGDQDLLALDPFRGVRILSPQAFLTLSDQTRP
jgi:putative PIN family toxin of toxin-antitoxin system